MPDGSTLISCVSGAGVGGWGVEGVLVFSWEVASKSVRSFPWICGQVPGHSRTLAPTHCCDIDRSRRPRRH